MPGWYLAELSQHYEQFFDFEEGKFFHLWPLVELAELNRGYEANETYPGFFLIGSDGGGEACVIEKGTGSLYLTPFIGNIPGDNISIGSSYDELINYLRQPW